VFNYSIYKPKEERVMKKSIVVLTLGIAASLFVGCERLKNMKTSLTDPKGTKAASSNASGVYEMPFEVSVGGQKAVVKGGNDTFGRVQSPVTEDAEIEIHTDCKDAIINIFFGNEKGEPQAGGKTIVIMAKGNKCKISDRMDKKKFEMKPGYYLMNVVAKGNTSRVVFQLK
jgi:hypothetical protein